MTPAQPNPTGTFYDRFAILYPLVDAFLKRQKKRLVQEVNALPPGRLLEVGVGRGTELRHYKAHHITGIDVSPGMLAGAAKQLPPNATLRQMSCEALAFETSTFDIVVMSHVLAVIKNPEAALSEAFRVMKPGGHLLVLNHFTPRNNWVRFVDKAFSCCSGLFHFKSLFYADDLQGLRQFRMVKDVSFGPFAYFRLLILRAG